MIDQLSGQILAGKYRVESFWREDAISKTYHAVQVSIDKPVTIKILNSDLIEHSDLAASFQTEARILSRIANPHILNVLDIQNGDNETPFLVLEASEGRSLREFIREAGGSSLERASAIVSQVADALTTAFSNNVVHGSLASDKIFMAEQRNGADFIKVLDFGAATDSLFDNEKTVVRANLPFYKAPEQFTAGEADARTDVYALGVLLFELLTGRPPFVDENPAALAQKHLRDIPPSLIAMRPDLPAQLEQVVQRALAKQPNQRFQSSREFSDSLNNAVSGFSANATSFASAVETRPIPPVESQSANNPYKTAFIVLIGIVGLSILAIYFTGGFRNTPTQANFDPNAQPVQPLNPASSNGEDLSNIGLQPLGNSNLDPTLLPPGTLPPSGAAPPMGGIPPGLYPSGGGQTVTIPGDSNSIFMSDLNSNASPAVSSNINRNANVSTNTNVRPTTNTNAAATQSPRPVNANTGASNSNLTFAPSPVAPTNPPRPRTSPAPTATPAKTSGEESSKLTPSGDK